MLHGMKRIWCWLFHTYYARELRRNALIGGGYITICRACGCVRRYPCGSRGYDSKLADISVPDFAKPEDVPTWLAEQVATYGETLPVPKLTEDQHESIDPFSELVEKVHPDKIVLVQ